MYVMDIATKLHHCLLPSLEDSVINEIRCPSCKDFMWQPIFHCDRGHSFCSKCYNVGAQCKFCGSVCSGTRSHHLERIIGLLKYPCKYFGNGCQKKCRLEKLRDHEKECQTESFPCPLREDTECKFNGTRKQIVFHCQLMHSNFTFVSEKPFKQRILYKTLLDRVPPSRNEPFNFRSFYLYSFNDLLVQGKIQFDKDHVKLSMHRLALPSEMDDSYYFILNIYDSDDRMLCSFCKKCFVSDGRQDVVADDDDGVEVQFQMLKLCRYFTVEFLQSEF